MKKRLICLDAVRIFACLCVLTIHFNASVSGYDLTGQFVYNNAIIPNHIFGVYLGDYGVDLFFIVSGAALAYSKRGNWLNFYARRAKSIYPMFWTAFLAATMIEFLKNHGFTGGPSWHFLVSLAGIDGYALLMQWGGSSFYQLGEWFLGCIIIIYILFPLVYVLYEKSWQITSAVIITAVAGLSYAGVSSDWFFMKFAYIILGMVFVNHLRTVKRWDIWILNAILLLIRIVLAGILSSEIIRLITSWLTFCLLVLIAELAEKHLEGKSDQISRISELTYPLFLVHHKIISAMARNYPLESIGKRDIVFLYFMYLVLSAAAALAVRNVTRKIRLFLTK